MPLRFEGRILLGIEARYIFTMEVEFSWLNFAKTRCISPIWIRESERGREVEIGWFLARFQQVWLNRPRKAFWVLFA